MQDETNSIIKNTIEEKIAKFISYIFHPLLMPTYCFALLFFTKNYISTFTPPNLKYTILLITFVFTFLLPVINALILLKIGRIKSLQMETTKERIVPFLSTLVYFVAVYYLFYSAGFPNVFIIIILGAGISILFTFIINFWWKISIHAVGSGGLLGIVLGIIYRLQLDMNIFFMFTILLVGIIGYARLKLNTHSPSQIYTGILLGFITELLLMIFY